VSRGGAARTGRRRARAVFASASLALLWACGAARPALPPPVGFAPEHPELWTAPPPLSTEASAIPSLPIATFQLETGLTVSVVERPGSLSTVIRLWVPEAGDSAYGTVAAMVNALKAGTAIDGGVSVNPALGHRSVWGVTEPQGTTLHWEVLSRASEKAIDLLGRYVAHPAFEEQETLASVRQIVGRLQAYSNTLSYLEDLGRDAMPGLTFPRPDEQARELLQLSTAGIARLHACRMVPRGAELVVVGGVSTAAVSTWVRRALADWKGTSAEGCPRSQPVAGASDAPLLRPQLFIIGAAQEDPRVRIILPAPPIDHADFLPFLIESTALAQRQAGVADTLRHGGETYGIHAYVNTSLRGRSLLEIAGSLSPEHATESLRQIVLDLGAGSQRVNDADIAMAKRQLAASRIAELGSDAQVADAVLFERRRGRSPRSTAEPIAEILGVEPEACRTAAQRWTDNVNPVIVAAARRDERISDHLNLGVETHSLRLREAR
jgi:predicted Zn-dependent peptidase